MKLNNVARPPGQEPLVQPSARQLMIVASSAVLDAATWKWTYQVKPAIAAAAAAGGAATRPGWPAAATERALSVSEMGNTTTFVCGGIAVANLPAGFVPVKLHNGAAVWCEGARDDKGQFYWAIVSPGQAIDGTCP